MKKIKILLSIFLIYVIFCMVKSPSTFMLACLDGVKAWAFNVLPGVLPFLFLTKALSELGQIERFSEKFSKPFAKILNCPPSASYVFLMSMISGYPVGAKLTADLYESGKISRSEAFRMTSFCSTSGPMFVIGAVGAGMLLSVKAGYLIFISHILGALVNGFVWRKVKTNEETRRPQPKQNSQNDIGKIVTDSMLSILAVGTIIAIFFVIIQSLGPVFNLLPEGLRGLASGLIEITHGCLDISGTLPLKVAILACTFVISFGGISTILQSLTMLERLKMPVKIFTFQKLTHAFFSTAICGLLVLFF